MRITFRQGIVRHQTDISGSPAFLQKVGQYVNLIVSPDPTIVTFAHGQKNYLYTEATSVSQAWGPFDTGTNYWLYWDINLVNGERTFGSTVYEPLVSANQPSLSCVDSFGIPCVIAGRMWYNTVRNIMYEYNGASWVEVVRVFACKLELGTTIRSMSIRTPEFIGTQVGLTTPAYAGAIAFDTAGKPIRTGDRKFFTTEDMFLTGVPTGASLKVNNIVLIGQAQEPISAFHVVEFVDYNKIIHASPFNSLNKIYGIIEEDAHTNDVINFVTEGLIFNEQWDWDAEGGFVNDKVYITNTGEITLIQSTPNQASVGMIIDRQTILFKPTQPQVLLPSSGVTDHGALTGLDDDDHLQYFNITRGDARYALISHTHTLEGSLTDVSITNKLPNEVLTYDGATWRNLPIPSVITDHGALTGLNDDDHSQYHNDARGDARYSLLGHIHDDRYYTEGEIDIFLSGKSNVGHTHILLADLPDDFTVSAPAPGQIFRFNGSKWENEDFPAVGEVNIGSNVGGGAELYNGKTGATLLFKTLIAGTNVSFTEAPNTITINSTAAGGVEYLADLLDVDITGVSDKNILAFDEAESKWRPLIFDAGDICLSTLCDVDVGDLQPYDILRYKKPTTLNYLAEFSTEPANVFILDPGHGDVTGVVPPPPFTASFASGSSPGCDAVYTVIAAEYDNGWAPGSTVLFVLESPPGVCPNGFSDGTLTIQSPGEDLWYSTTLVAGAGINITNTPEEVIISSSSSSIIIPYDIATNYIGAPLDGDTILRFAAVTKFKLIGVSGSATVVKGYAGTPPVSEAIFEVFKTTPGGSPSSIGTFAWSFENEISSRVFPDEIFDPDANEIILVTCITADDIADFGFTIKAVQE